MSEQDQRQRAAGAPRTPADAAPREIIDSPHGKHGGSEESEGAPQEHEGSPARNATPSPTHDSNGNQSESQTKRETDRLGR